jgi:hypothetical protein
MALAHISGPRGGMPDLVETAHRSAPTEPREKRIRRALRQATVWTVGTGCAALWLVLLTESHFSSVTVALGLLCVILILR